MPLWLFLDYMEGCRASGVTPTWEGLRAYADHEKSLGKHEKGAIPEGMAPYTH